MVGGESLIITLATEILGYFSQKKHYENLIIYIYHNQAQQEDTGLYYNAVDALRVRNIYL